MYAILTLGGEAYDENTLKEAGFLPAPLRGDILVYDDTVERVSGESDGDDGKEPEEVDDGSDIDDTSVRNNVVVGDNLDSDGDLDVVGSSRSVDSEVSESDNVGSGEVIEEEVAQAQSYEATAYTAYCEGCSGITYSGVDVRNTEYYEGKRVIAVDPSVIPIGSDVQVTLDDGRTFEGTAQDIGGAIKGRKIDILVSNRDKALDFGRQSVEVRVLN